MHLQQINPKRTLNKRQTYPKKTNLKSTRNQPQTEFQPTLNQSQINPKPTRKKHQKPYPGQRAWKKTWKAGKKTGETGTPRKIVHIHCMLGLDTKHGDHWASSVRTDFLGASCWELRPTTSRPSPQLIRFGATTIIYFCGAAGDAKRLC